MPTAAATHLGGEAARRGDAAAAEEGALNGGHTPSKHGHSARKQRAPKMPPQLWGGGPLWLLATALTCTCLGVMVGLTLDAQGGAQWLMAS